MSLRTGVLNAVPTLSLPTWRWTVYRSFPLHAKRRGFSAGISCPPPPSHCRALSLTFAPSAKLLVNDRRALLKEDVIEASECLKHWQNEGLINWNEEDFA
jgi:hypothetical protein